MLNTTIPSKSRRRPAATIVEGAFVISLFLLFLFGILEYSRYLMFLHVTTNAVRDGARYASVNVDKPSTFTTTDYTQGAFTYRSITGYTTERLGGCQKMLNTGYTIEIFPCNPTSLAATPPVVSPKGGFVGATAWNEASFTERICVRLTGKYRFVLPTFLFMDSEINVSISSVVGSEG